jgi:exonuclease III
MSGKETQMLALARDEDLDVILLQETELRHFYASIFSIPGYDIFAEEGQEKVRVMTSVQRGSFDSVTRLEYGSPNSTKRQEVALSLEQKGSRPITIINYYSEWLQEDLKTKQNKLQNMISNITTTKRDRLYAMADLNLDLSRDDL